MLIKMAIDTGIEDNRTDTHEMTPVYFSSAATTI